MKVYKYYFRIEGEGIKRYITTASNADSARSSLSNFLKCPPDCLLLVESEDIVAIKFTEYEIKEILNDMNGNA